MLPQELVRNIFELAAESEMPERLAMPVTLSLVCSASRVWMRTVLYKTVHISLLHEWEAFRRTVLHQRGALPVINLSLLVRPPPPDYDVAEVLNALPQLNRVQVCLSLVPQLAASSVRRLAVSKHGPAPSELPATLRLTRITHLYFEPFYSALYPPALRAALPSTFPALTHFGLAYVPSTDAVARDLLDLMRRMLALPDMRRLCVHVMGAQEDAERLEEMCRANGIRDGRVYVGHVNMGEWLCPPGAERIDPTRSLWTCDALGWLDLWNHEGRVVTDV